MDSLETQLKLPDLWQQSAIRALQAGKDVIVAAPTGAGKTYVFELVIENGFQGQAIYTVPTRALANDKLMEWKQRGWDVGITTGDRSENTGAKVVVATLETQKSKLIRGDGPDMLVIDEYQMIGDEQRGLNYELSIACAPSETQLLLLSGSVGNPQHVADWLTRLGRKVQLVRHQKRPVPLEEINVEGLPNRLPDSVHGFWPRAIAKVLKAEMAPLLAFAPRRNAAEDLAYEIARMLPEEDPLVLTPEQERLAGDGLKRLLRARIAFHHSGLDYGQRAGLIEPLAKAGQLRVVVATMGLAAGINFSMRSVLVTDRRYRSAERLHEVRPDELLQMFGRAGRRGMDKVGYIIIAPGKPRLQEARPLHLRRANQIDWPSLIGVMQNAIEASECPIQATRKLTNRLFSIQHIALGLADFHEKGPQEIQEKPRIIRQSVTEIQNFEGEWERKKAPRTVSLSNCQMFHKGEWKPALSVADTLVNVHFGTICKFTDGKKTEFGRQMPVARLGNTEKEGELVLTRGLVKSLKALNIKRNNRSVRWKRMQWKLDRVESVLLPLMPQISLGGIFDSWMERNNMLYARLRYHDAVTMAQVDSNDRGLINPPIRKVEHEVDMQLTRPTVQANNNEEKPVAELWHSLGLIDGHGAPTRRGILFSYFNYGEGLAVAAALEDRSYAIEDIVYDLANIRAGHRFEVHEAASSRLGAACRAIYGLVTHPGYLSRGLPSTYGEGAAEILFLPEHRQQGLSRQTELRMGDIERTRLEWRSLLRHIAHAPRLNWDRWQALQEIAKREVVKFPREISLENLPALTPKQRQRHKSFLFFDSAS